MSDDWYIEGVTVEGAHAQRAYEAATVEAREALEQAGQAEVARRYDVGAMAAAGVPMNGTTQARFRNDDRRFVSHFDTSTGESMARPATMLAPLAFPARFAESPVGTFLMNRLEAGEEAARTAASAVYEFGSGLWNLGADVNEWLGLGPHVRAPSADDLGMMPEGTPAQVVARMAPLLVGFGVARKGLQGLVHADRAIFQRMATDMGAAAITDFTIGDPREGSLLELMVQFNAIQRASVENLNPADLHETVGPMAARFALAAEGLVLGSLVQGARAAGGKLAVLGSMLSLQADTVEETAVKALTRSQATPADGLDPIDSGWLTVFFGARIMKGMAQLDDAMRQDAGVWGATADQIEAAWNRAATLAQEANRQAMRPFMGEGAPDGG